LPYCSYSINNLVSTPINIGSDAATLAAPATMNSDLAQVAPASVQSIRADIPLEIFAEVLGKLALHRSNRRALIRCSLVCSQWNAIVQPLLFRSITLYAENAPYSDLSASRYLFHESAHLPNLVHTLKLYPGVEAVDNDGSDIPPHSSFLTAMAEEGLVALLESHVSCLEVKAGDYYLFLLDTTILSRFSNITVLRLSNLILGSLDFLLGDLPHLHSLSLDCVGMTLRTPLEKMASLKKLAICLDDKFWNAYNYSAPLHLRHLTFQYEHEHGGNGVCRGVKVAQAAAACNNFISSSLESLTLYAARCLAERSDQDDIMLR
jgi:hypothetical protein